MAFGFSGGWFYIKANSDRRWLTDKTDRCNANPEKTPIMKPVTSEYKSSTIAYKMPLPISPKTAGLLSAFISTGLLMQGSRNHCETGQTGRTNGVYRQEETVKEHIVNNEEIQIGRNDDDGYYFKFGHLSCR